MKNVIIACILIIIFHELLEEIFYSYKDWISGVCDKYIKKYFKKNNFLFIVIEVFLANVPLFLLGIMLLVPLIKF